MSTKEADRRTRATIRRIEKHEDSQLKQRKSRLIAALRKNEGRLLDFEVRRIEEALAPALGRIMLER